jgi:hypothetical protein
MFRALFTISMLTCLAGNAAAEQTAFFPNASYAADAMNVKQSGPGIATIESLFDEPVIMLSEGPDFQTPTHFQPTKPGADNTAFGDSSTPSTKTVVIPLPAPAGLAIAGLVLLGATRRR